ncbi:MAG: class I SAM-dependent methyltransferase [Spirochaetales bacterium]|nr:class I SAM-dependent methyltransferase [Spirochaetales bacterium]
MNFKDHFSHDSRSYARARPDYPSALFEFLNAHCRSRDLAWDCGTGSGQAARQLTKYFREVVATDASAAQIHAALEEGIVRPGLIFRTAPAEDSGLPDCSADLITVAQALHWFDFERFYAEVRRVLRPDGLLAVWCYELMQTGKEIDKLLHYFYHDVVGPYWPADRRFIEEHYATIPFPFEELTVPNFYIETSWNLEEYVNYLATWSAVKRYREARQADPVPEIRSALAAVWGPSDVRRSNRWPIYMRLGHTG